MAYALRAIGKGHTFATSLPYDYDAANLGEQADALTFETEAAATAAKDAHDGGESLVVEDLDGAVGTVDDPTPWTVRRARGAHACMNYEILPTPEIPYERVALVESKLNAERIVACVNACAGLDDETVAAIPALVALVMVRLAAQPSVKNEIERFIMPPKAEA